MLSEKEMENITREAIQLSVFDIMRNMQALLVSPTLDKDEIVPTAHKMAEFMHDLLETLKLTRHEGRVSTPEERIEEIRDGVEALLEPVRAIAKHSGLEYIPDDFPEIITDNRDKS